MKLQSFVIRQAITEGRYEDAVRYVLQHFDVALPDSPIQVKEYEDIGCGLLVWVNADAYEWYEGAFFCPDIKWHHEYRSNDAQEISAKIFVKRIT